MAYLNDIIARVQKLNFVEITRSIVVDTEDSIADAQREQMLHGINAEGGKIGVYAQPAYEREKYNQNPLAGGYVDLRRTGAFYKGIYATVIGGELVIDSSDPKTPDLEKKYHAIFGLHGEFRRNYIGKGMEPAYMKEISNRIGLPFSKRT